VNISNGGTVTAITRTAAGSGYTSLPEIAISAPTTAGGVTATATASGLALVGSVAVVSGGTGYTVGDTLTLAGFTGTAPTFTVTTVSAGVVTAITSTSGGNFTVAPASPASVTGGTGSGATISFTAGVLGTFTITNAGSGYVEQPTVTFSGGGGSGAAAYAAVGSGAIIRGLSGSSGVTPSISFYTAGGEALRIADGGQAANYWNVQASPANGAPQLRVLGSDTNVGMLLSTKGTGSTIFYSNGFAQQQFQISHTASAVNYVQVTGAATGSATRISTQGSDANVGMDLVLKGTPFGPGFRVQNQGGTGTCFSVVVSTASVANHPRANPSAAGNPVSFSAEGSDTNIDLALTPKGTGNVRFGTYTADMTLIVQGFIEVKDSGGTIRKLAVIA
jgi:hypothetical protein